MKLPDIKVYRSNFEEQGLVLPLPVIPGHKDGLLDVLPTPPTGKTGWPWTEQTDAGLYNDGTFWPKLTIVTPSYNQGTFIEETIRSILLQNYPNLEYIVIDGGSSDQTVEILKKYSPWISYWRSEKDRGQGHAINLGFSLAAGDYYAWINSDDYYLAKVFHRIARTFINTRVKFIYGYGLSYQVSKNQFDLVKVLPFWDFFIKIPSLLQPSTFWAAYINQPIWEVLNCSLDFELWLRLVKGQKRKLIKEPLSVAHMHLDSKTMDPGMKQKWEADHLNIWSDEGHGQVYEWKRIMFLNRVRMKLYKLLNWI